MSDLESEIAALLKPVIAQLAALFNRHTAATFARAASLSGPEIAAAAKKAGVTTPTATKRKPSKAAPTGRAVRKKGPGSASLEASLLAHIQANPGARMEQISRVLGVPTKKLQGPAAKLLASGAVRREGETRATRYFPTEGGAASPAPAADAPATGAKRGPKKGKR